MIQHGGRQTEVAPYALAADSICYSVAGRILLDNLSFSVLRGQSVAITGPSGSGKSTLLMVLAGLIPAAAGSIIIDGVETAGFSAQRWAAVRLAKLGIIYQFGELLPELNPVENVILPALLAGSDPKSARAHAAGLLQALQVGATERMNTATLSGGERQRVAAARALINRPAVLLADEPTGALDATTADIVAELLFSLPKQYGCGVVVVTHNPQVADRADVQLSLNAGKLRQAIR